MTLVLLKKNDDVILLLRGSPVTKNARKKTRLSPSYRLSRQAKVLVREVLYKAQKLLDSQSTHGDGGKHTKESDGARSTVRESTAALDSKDSQNNSAINGAKTRRDGAKHNGGKESDG